MMMTTINDNKNKAPGEVRTQQSIRGLGGDPLTFARFARWAVNFDTFQILQELFMVAGTFGSGRSAVLRRKPRQTPKMSGNILSEFVGILFLWTRLYDLFIWDFVPEGESLCPENSLLSQLHPSHWCWNLMSLIVSLKIQAFSVQWDVCFRGCSHITSAKIRGS